MTNERKFEFEVSQGDDDVAYLKLPGHPGARPGAVKRTVDLRDLLPDYKGPKVYLDFEEEGRLIGVEIVG